MLSGGLVWEPRRKHQKRELSTIGLFKMTRSTDRSEDGLRLRLVKKWRRHKIWMINSQENTSSLTRLVWASCADHLPCPVDGIIWQRAERETGYFSRCWLPQYAAGVCDHQQLWPHGNPRPASPVHLCNTSTRNPTARAPIWHVQVIFCLLSSLMSLRHKRLAVSTMTVICPKLQWKLLVLTSPVSWFTVFILSTNVL